jgi:hypothetical protein
VLFLLIRTGEAYHPEPESKGHSMTSTVTHRLNGTAVEEKAPFGS